MSLKRILHNLPSGAEIFDTDGDINRLEAIIEKGLKTSVLFLSSDEANRIKLTHEDKNELVNVVISDTPMLDKIKDQKFHLIIGDGHGALRGKDFNNEVYRILKPGGSYLLTGSELSLQSPISQLKESNLEYQGKIRASVNNDENHLSLYHFVRATEVIPGVPSRSIIRTQRLYMRPWKREDLDHEDLWPDFLNPVYRHYNPPRDDKEARDNRFKKIVGLFDLRLSIFDQDGLAGYIALFGTDMKQKISEVGINFAAHKITQGYGKESLRALCDAYFYRWGMDRMRLESSIFNKIGLRCYQSCGFGETKQWWNGRAVQRFFNYENNPRLASVKHHFRKGENGVEVEFVEMQVSKEEYFDKFGSKELS